MISWDISNIIDISVCIQLGCSDNQFRQMWNVATPCKASFQTKVKVTKVTIQTNMNCKFRQVSMTDSDKSQLSIQTNINYQFRHMWMINSDKYQWSIQTNMKCGPSLQGQLSQASTRVHRPWQPGLITFLNLTTKNFIMSYMYDNIMAYIYAIM